MADPVTDLGMIVLEAVWKTFSLQAKDSSRRLVIPATVALDTSVLDFLVDNLRKLPEAERPREIVVEQSTECTPDDGSVDLMVQLLQLCRKNLRRLNFRASLGRPLMMPSFYGEVLSRTPSIVTNLESLNLHYSAPDEPQGHPYLVAPFASGLCRINELAIRDMRHAEINRILVKENGGLCKLDVECWGEQEEDETLLLAIRDSPSQLTHLRIKDCCLETLDTLVVSVIRAHPKLQVLDLFQCSILPSVIDQSSSQAKALRHAIAQHPSLQVLLLKSCGVGNSFLSLLLSAAQENPRLHTLNISDDEPDLITFKGDWIAMLPKLKNLRSLHGLAPLISKPDWSDLVTPALRQNTSLFSLATPDNEVTVDEETTQILNRNKLLSETARYWKSAGSPILPVWPKVLYQLASNHVVSTAFYQFIRNKVEEIPEPMYMAGMKRLAKECRHLRQEVKRLKRQIAN